LNWCGTLATAATSTTTTAATAGALLRGHGRDHDCEHKAHCYQK
jgi:hypothetical protein